MSAKNPSYYVTTPIYYVNDAPHIGHAYTSVAADVLARFKRLDGYDVFFLTGTDEHGQKIERSAEKAGVSPKEYVDGFAEKFKALSTLLNLSDDHFIRTTSPAHHACAKAIWTRLVERGHIYKGHYAGWYAVRDEAFYNEKELVNGKAPTGADVEWVEEESYFFNLSQWQEPLLEFYANNPDFMGPQSRRNEVVKFVEGGLRDLSVSRSTFGWGVPVPGDEAHVMYVWLDALTNYLTALGFPDENAPLYKEHWPNVVHLVGKDILRFHAVYWPAFLMAAGITPPKRLFAHGWWTNEGQKISKSLGNTIDPHALVATYGLDQVRYFMMREIPFGGDGDFSDAAIRRRTNSDLANDFGNLSQRVLSFVAKHAGAVVPTPGDLHPEDKALLAQIEPFLKETRAAIDQQALSRYCEILWTGIAEANRYVDAVAPWSLRKTDTARMETVLYVLMEVLRRIAILAQPITPGACAKILDQLSVPEDRRSFAFLDKALTPGVALPTPEGVFPRLVEEK
jgi:methionyl-tRNA synthetase